MDPLNLWAKNYDVQPQGETNYPFWDCYIGHNKIEPYLSCLNTNQFMMQYWIIDSNTDLYNNPLNTAYFPADGSYTNIWWPGHN